MNKAELIAHIEHLQQELDAAGVNYVKADTTGTNADLEKEIGRLELLLDEGGESASDSQAGNTSVEADDQVQVTINKGVNVEIMIDGVRRVLKGEKTYTLPADRVKSIVAEKLGELA